MEKLTHKFADGEVLEAKPLNEMSDAVNGLIDDTTDMMSTVFPLKASYVSSNSGTREVGTEVTPTASFSITRNGADVSASAIVSATGTTIAGNNKSWTANKSVSSGSNSFSTTVAQGGQSVSLGALTWAFTYYRYYGEVASISPDLAGTIKGLNKQLSTSASMGTTRLSANRYFLFAVKGANLQFNVTHAATGAKISGCITGNIEINQENDKGKNIYSYVFVPASSSAWEFKIN